MGLCHPALLGGLHKLQVDNSLSPLLGRLHPGSHVTLNEKGKKGVFDWNTKL